VSISPLNKGQARIDATGEAFTPPSITNRMLDFLTPSAWVPTATFLDPTCGNGQMLIVFLQRKLALGHDPLLALNSIFGADIQPDNIDDSRTRLLEIATPLLGNDLIRLSVAKQIVEHNVFLVKDSLTFDWDSYQPFDLQQLILNAYSVPPVNRTDDIPY
jgi:SAM-dependent methyltransferase